MAVVARGHVRDRPFARTVYAIAAKRFTGELAMNEAGRDYRVVWRGGQVVAAQSASPADSLPRIALTAGLINSTQVAEIMRAVAATPGADHLEALTQVARLTPVQASQLRRRALVHRALRIFALPEATFVLDTESALVSEASPLDVRWLIYHGVRLHYSEERLAKDLAAVAGSSFRLARTPEALEPYGFDATARDLLALLAQRAMTADELAAGGASAKDIAVVLYTLLATDAVAVEQTTSPARSLRAHTIPPMDTAPSAPARPTPSASPASASSSAPASASSSAPASASSSAAAVSASSSSSAAEPAVRGGSRAIKLGVGKGQEARKRSADPARVALIRELIAAKLAAMDAGVDHYELLGVARDAVVPVIRNAYFDLARQLHPDRLRAAGVTDRPADAQRLFARINEAFAVLSNPEQRAAYDDQGGGGDDAESMAARLLAAEQHFLRGEMALRRNQFSQAHGEFEKAVELNPDEAEHHALLAWTRWCTAADQSAVRAQVELGFKRAIELSRRNVPAHYYRGQVAASAGELQVALDCFRRVLEIQPDHRDAGLQVRLLESRLAEQESKKKGLLDRLKRR